MTSNSHWIGKQNATVSLIKLQMNQNDPRKYIRVLRAATEAGGCGTISDYCDIDIRVVSLLDRAGDSMKTDQATMALFHNI